MWTFKVPIYPTINLPFPFVATYAKNVEGDGNLLQCSCLENPRDGGAWWAAVYGVTQSRTRLKRLSRSSSRGTWKLSSLTRNRTHAPWIGRWSLNHWTAREVLRQVSWRQKSVSDSSLYYLSCFAIHIWKSKYIFNIYIIYILWSYSLFLSHKISLQFVMLMCYMLY